MSISEDIKRIEAGLEAGPNDPDPEGEARYDWHPNRIKRVLDALKELQKNGPQVLRGAHGDGSDWYGTMADAWDDALKSADAEAQYANELRTRLSKAIELLKDCQASIDPDSPQGARVRAFLSQDSQT